MTGGDEIEEEHRKPACREYGPPVPVGRNGFWLVLFLDASMPSKNNAGEGDGNEFDSPREGNGGRGGQVRKGKKSR